MMAAILPPCNTAEARRQHTLAWGTQSRLIWSWKMGWVTRVGRGHGVLLPDRGPRPCWQSCTVKNHALPPRVCACVLAAPMERDDSSRPGPCSRAAPGGSFHPRFSSSRVSIEVRHPLWVGARRAARGGRSHRGRSVSRSNRWRSARAERAREEGGMWNYLFSGRSSRLRSACARGRSGATRERGRRRRGGGPTRERESIARGLDRSACVALASV